MRRVTVKGFWYNAQNSAPTRRPINQRAATPKPANWEGLEDPGTGNAALHDFHELLMIALCAVLCGGQGAVDMALFAKAKEPFLRGFLRLANGLPSHDTFSRLFCQLDPAQFGAAFSRFMAGFCASVEGVVAIDGKVLRRSFDHASGKSPLHMVSAWGCEQRIVLAQVATDAKSNEITAVCQIASKRDPLFACNVDPLGVRALVLFVSGGGLST